MSRFDRAPAKRWDERALDATLGKLTGKTMREAPHFKTSQGRALEVIDTDTQSPHQAWKLRTVGERPHRVELVTLVIPFPPTTNHDKLPNGQGGQYLLPETEAFRNEVAGAAFKAGCPWVRGKLTVVVTLYPPDRRAYDIDNRVKPTLDALQAAGVIVNDRQVKRLTIAEAEIRAGGEAHVTVHGDPL